jgi:hypothetical protein
MWYHLDMNFECYETKEGVRNPIFICSINHKELSMYSKEPVFNPSSPEIEMKIAHAFHQKFLEVTGRIHECYECGESVVQLSKTSRCMKCMERRLDFNEHDAETQRSRVLELESAIRELRGVSEND